MHPATKKMIRLSAWKQVKYREKVPEPQLFVREGRKLKTVAVYTPICRAAMIPCVLRNRLRTREADRFFLRRIPLPAYIHPSNHGDEVILRTFAPSPCVIPS